MIFSRINISWKYCSVLYLVSVAQTMDIDDDANDSKQELLQEFERRKKVNSIPLCIHLVYTFYS